MKKASIIPLFLLLQMLLLGVCTSCCANHQSAAQPDSCEKKTLSLFFAGDLMQHLPQVNAARQADGSYAYEECFTLIQDDIAAADFAIANFETTLAGKPYSGYPCFSSPDDFLKALKNVGFDVMLTANNHACDKGKLGIERTLLMMDSFQLAHVGTYADTVARKQHHPLLLRKKGFTLALLNYTYGTNGIPVPRPNVVNLIDTTSIHKDIARAKQAHADIIIACLHWGTEYMLTPNSSQRALAQWLLEKGVDHVIGSHPHVPQPLEVVITGNQEHIVAYSLGNFISNQRDPHTDEGYAVRLDFEKDSLLRFVGYQQIPYVVSRPATSGRKQYRVIPLVPTCNAREKFSCVNSFAVKNLTIKIENSIN